MKNIYTFHQWKIQNANELIWSRQWRWWEAKWQDEAHFVSCSFMREDPKWQHRRYLRSRIEFGKWKFTRYLKPRSPWCAPGEWRKKSGVVRTRLSEWRPLFFSKQKLNKVEFLNAIWPLSAFHEKQILEEKHLSSNRIPKTFWVMRANIFFIDEFWP